MCKKSIICAGIVSIFANHDISNVCDDISSARLVLMQDKYRSNMYITTHSWLCIIYTECFKMYARNR